MSDCNIENTMVEAAFAVAGDALSNESYNLAWITKSALIERAYFLGLYFRLSAIADNSQISTSKTVLGGFSLNKHKAY